MGFSPMEAHEMSAQGEIPEEARRPDDGELVTKNSSSMSSKARRSDTDSSETEDDESTEPDESVEEVKEQVSDLF